MPPSTAFSKPLYRYFPIALILFIGLIHGLLYVFVVPPWQHPDEPANFEMVWLNTYNPVMLEARKFDPEGRQLIYKSMIAHNFFGANQKDPQLVEPTVIIDQLAGNDSQVYFWLAGLPSRLIDKSNIDQQLNVARLVSLLLFLISIFTSWMTVREIAPPNHILTWMLPLFLAMLPGYVNIMTSVNNDVGAVVMFSLFIWAGVRTIQRGITWVNLLLVLFTSVLAALMKTTAVIAIPLIILVVILAVLRRWSRKVTVAILVGGTVLVSFLFLSVGDAISWLPTTSQNIASPVQVATLLGNHCSARKF